MSGDAADVGAPAVRLRGVRKRFGHREVLRGVTFDVPAASCFGLFGGNGVGKSTLLRIVSTQWTCSGVVEVAGYDVRKHAARVRAMLGAVFHESFLRRELTLEENLRYACALYRQQWKSVRSRAMELLERFGLERRRGDQVRTYSQGMTKRAGLVRSLVHEPSLWILDEPFSGLDAQGRELLEGMIEDYVAAGRTVLLVTHNAEIGARLASRGLLLVAGQVARELDLQGDPAAARELARLAKDGTGS